eukprot:NODE_3446_length_973_cov_47.507576_g3168_i0.p1 GENE.NODE_3446_length_973_cov_47.507576_g3168_i0~~NODE_3446_length_973_cov_47.507576_g3168_i0.p1  ORF type:complete len:176 (-),score=10.72 NODE_3446_length_973_cov_47.507576_g3168_i0:225-752(-)
MATPSPYSPRPTAPLRSQVAWQTCRKTVPPTKEPSCLEPARTGGAVPSEYRERYVPPLNLGPTALRKPPYSTDSPRLSGRKANPGKNVGQSERSDVTQPRPDGRSHYPTKFGASAVPLSPRVEVGGSAAPGTAKRTWAAPPVTYRSDTPRGGKRVYPRHDTLELRGGMPFQSSFS